MSIYTIDDYKAKLQSHVPCASPEEIECSVALFREYVEKAKETGEKQEFIDCRTGEVGIICYPNGHIEWVEADKKPPPKRLPEPLPLHEVQRGFPGVEIAFGLALAAAALVVFIYALIQLY